MLRRMFLNEERAERIHEASLQVLEGTGIWLDHEEAETLLLEAGAKRDDEHRILIPRRMVQAALEKAFAKVQFFDRDGNRSIVVRNGQTHFGTGSDALYNIDLERGQLRRSVLSDITNNVRLADGLSGFGFVMSMALPADVEPRKLYAVIFAEMVRNTSKPLVVTSTTVEDIEQIHRIASIVAGGEDALRTKPFFLAYLEPISPLRFNRSIVTRVLYCAEHGIPILFAAGANCGGGAPVTPEGGLVQGSAESLAGLVLALLKNENAKFVYGANTSVIDMRTSIISYGAPEWYRTVAMYADMGKHYNLPSWGTAGCTDSFALDAQSAMEAYEGILLALLSGTSLAHDVGFMAHGALYDARMLILTDEMVKRARFLLKDVDVSDDALSVDMIDEVARTNALYLAHPRTCQIFRNVLWLPPAYINRSNIADYVKKRPLADYLNEAVAGALSSHQPKELPEPKVTEVQQYLDSL